MLNPSAQEINHAASSDAALPRVEGAEPLGGVTPRIVVLCLALAGFFGYLIPIIDLKLTNTFLGRSQLPPGAVGALLVLLGANVVLTRVSARWSFSRNEVLTVYACCLFATYVPGHGSESNFVQNIVGTFYYATNDNGWLRWLEPLLRPWLSPALHGGSYGAAGRALATGWYNGTDGVVPWAAWLVPLFVWGAFILTLYFMLGCLAVMLHAQWSRREVLRYPLLQLPIDITAHLDGQKENPSFWRNGLMWRL